MPNDIIYKIIRQWTNTILIEESNNIKYIIFVFANTEFLFLDQFPFIRIISNKKEIKIEINTSKEVVFKRLIYRYHMQIIHRYIDMQ